VRLIERIGRLSRTMQVAVYFALIMLLSALDCSATYFVSFSVMYVVPVYMASWNLGRAAGVLMSAASAAAGLFADYYSGSGLALDPLIPVWNTLIRLGVFLVVAFVVSALRRSQAKQRQLVDFIVHDLRAPLASVRFGLGSLGKTERYETNELVLPRGELIGMMEASSDRMASLIDSIIDLTRLETGRMPLERQRVPVKELAEGSLKLVSVWARKEKISLELSVEPGLETVFADRTLTERVLLNLLSNAIKCAPADSSVILHIAPAESGRVLFRVSDEGPGVPPALRSALLDGTVQDGPPGRSAGTARRGLGLTFSRLAVEAQGGRLQIEDGPEKGATFSFTLPAPPNGS